MTRRVELKLVQGNLVAVTLAPVMDGEYFVSAYDGEEVVSKVNGWPRYTIYSDEQKWQRVVGTNHPMHNLPKISQATIFKWYEGYRFFELRFTIMNDREYPVCDHEGELCTAVIQEDNVGNTESWETLGLTDDSLRTYDGNLMFYSTEQVKELIKRAAFEDNTIILLDGIEEWFKNNLK